MGNSNTPRQIQHHRYLGDVRVVRYSERDFLKVNLPISEDVRFWKAQRQQLKAHKSLFLPCSQVTSSSCCGSSFTQIYFQYFPITLQQQINHRRQSGQMFQQEELWLITWTLAQAANTLHLQGKRLADVQPNSVMADYSGQLKVVCEASLPNVLTSVEKVRLKMLKSYVAPEELQRVNAKDGLRNDQTTEAFEIGMTLLHIALLKPCFDIYDYEETLIRISLLANRVKQLEDTQYPDSFKEIIKGLLQPDPRHRMTTYQLYKKLQPFGKQIESLCQFDIDNTASKTGATVFNLKPSKVKLSCRSTGSGWNEPPSNESSPSQSTLGRVQQILAKLQAKIDQRLKISKQLLK